MIGHMIVGIQIIIGMIDMNKGRMTTLRESIHHTKNMMITSLVENIRDPVQGEAHPLHQAPNPKEAEPETTKDLYLTTEMKGDRTGRKGILMKEKEVKYLHQGEIMETILILREVGRDTDKQIRLDTMSMAANRLIRKVRA